MFHHVQSNGMRVIDTTQRRQELAVTRRNEAGFTLLEVLVVVALLGTLAAMAIMVSPAFLKSARADAGIEQAMDTLRLARETAISQRRNVRVVFVGLDAIQTTREDIGANGVVTGTTVLRTVQFENRMQFRVVERRAQYAGRVLADGRHYRRCSRVRHVHDSHVHERRHVRESSRRRVERDDFSGDPGRPAERARDHDLRTDGPHPRLALERPRLGGVGNG